MDLKVRGFNQYSHYPYQNTKWHLLAENQPYQHLSTLTYTYIYLPTLIYTYLHLPTLTYTYRYITL